MNNTLKFGLSDSLINTVREVVEGKVCPTCGKSPCQCDGDVKKVEEALKGGQKKLDKNHNGKLDKQDFKMLRKEEIVVEGNPMNKEKKNAAATSMGAKNRDDQHLGSRGMKTDVADKIRGREKMSGKDRQQFEEVEQVDEISQATAYSYSSKSTDKMRQGLKPGEKKELSNIDKTNIKNAANRTDSDYYKKNNFKKVTKEEVEQLDELSPKTLYSYGSKAHNQVIKTGMGLTKRQGGLKTKGVSLEDGKRKMANRKAGVELAHKKAQVKTNEEIEQVDEVLDTPMKKLGYIAKNAYQVATADPAKMANDPKKANAIANRVIGAKRFQKKLNKEEVEELDELAPATMKSYQSKAVDSIGHASQSARSMGSDKDHLKKPLGNEIRKRKKGLDLANERLAKKDMDEETDPCFSEAEIARINEILKDL